jgi:hypothetical protein
LRSAGTGVEDWWLPGRCWTDINAFLHYRSVFVCHGLGYWKLRRSQRPCAEFVPLTPFKSYKITYLTWLITQWWKKEFSLRPPL